MALNHVALTVRDRDRSAAFYARHFDLTTRVHEDAHLLIPGSPDGALLALSEGEAPAAPPRTTHFGFRAADADEVRTARDELCTAGVIETEWQDDAASSASRSSTPTGTASSCSRSSGP